MASMGAHHARTVEAPVWTECQFAWSSSLDRVVKCNVYCTDAAHFGTFNEIYARYFAVESPARIFLCVAPFPGPLDIEVDCIAVV